MNYGPTLQDASMQGGAIGSKRPSTDYEIPAKKQAYAQECTTQANSRALDSPEAGREIPEKLARLENLIGEVRQTIEVLDDRIAPILSPSPPSTIAASAGRGCRSGLGGVLDSFADRLEMMQSRLSDIAYRVQL